MDSEAFERWLPTYRERADTVAAALGALFQEAMTHWASDESGKRSTSPCRVSF
jgi:hypothetical protein